jgi:DNA polymerase-3 subunit beta
MNITLLQENFYKALSFSSRIAQQKAQLPILENILIQATKEGITITAAGMDTTIISRPRGKVETEGSVCVNSRLLMEYVSLLPQDTVILSSGGTSLGVSCRKMNASIPGVSAVEYPPSPSIDKDKKGSKMKAGEFVSVLETVLFSAAQDEGRPLLSGIRLLSQRGKTEIVSTDGYRLTRKELQEEIPLSGPVIFPSRAIKEVCKICQEEKAENIMINETSDGQVCFSIGDTQLYTRRIEGEYPAYQKIIPQTHTTKVVVNAGDLRTSVKAVSVFAKDNANIVRLSITKKTLLLSAKSPSIGESKSEIEIELDGEDAEIAFNSRFLLEFLSLYNEESLIFEMTGALNPGVFKSPKDDTFLHIIMPVRINA